MNLVKKMKKINLNVQVNKFDILEILKNEIKNHDNLSHWYYNWI